MAGRNLLVQYRLDSNSADLLMQEAKRRNMTPNACASFLVKKSLTENSHLNENIVKITATNAFQLANGLVEIFKILCPEKTDEEVIALLNEKVFIPSKNRTEAHLKSLGLDI